MATESEIVEHIIHILNRPLMWVGSPEALEGVVLALVWALKGTDYHDEFAKWAADKHNVRRNSTLWSQKDFLVSDYANELKAFLRSEGII